MANPRNCAQSAPLPHIHRSAFPPRHSSHGRARHHAILEHPQGQQCYTIVSIGGDIRERQFDRCRIHTFGACLSVCPCRACVCVHCMCMRVFVCVINAHIGVHRTALSAHTGVDVVAGHTRLPKLLHQHIACASVPSIVCLLERLVLWRRHNAFGTVNIVRCTQHSQCMCCALVECASALNTRTLA